MAKKPDLLSRRERQIMDFIFSKGEADVQTGLSDAPSYSAVRTFLRILEEKGMLKHREEGGRYIYLPTESRQKASRSALKGVLSTFFEGSLANAVAALVASKDSQLTAEELQKLESKQARQP